MNQIYIHPWQNLKKTLFVQDLGEGRRRGQDAMYEPERLTSGPDSPVLAPIRPLALNSEVRLPGFGKSGRALSPYAYVPRSTFPSDRIAGGPQSPCAPFELFRNNRFAERARKRKGRKKEREKTCTQLWPWSLEMLHFKSLNFSKIITCPRTCHLSSTEKMTGIHEWKEQLKI